MIVTEENGKFTYLASTGDWVIEAQGSGISITLTLINNTQSNTFISGNNLDNLSVFIGQVKTDVLAKGLNWIGD